MGVMEARRRILLNTPHIITPASSGLQTFQTDMIAPLKECKVHFAPVQEGTGDPSPTNVRQISGRTGVEVYRTGKNLFDGSNYTAGELVPIHIAVGTPVTVSIKPIGNTIQVRYYDANQTQIDYWTLVYDSTLNRSVKSFSIINRDCEYVAIIGGSVNEPQLELGSIATPYAPYTGSTYSVSWQSAGTIYGGYVDVVRGEVVAEWGIVDLGTLSWNYNSTGKVFISSAINTTSNIGIGNKPNLLCPIYWTTKSSSYYGWSFFEEDKWISLLYDAPWVIVRDYAYNGDTTAFKTAMSGVSIVFALATPIHYALTPQIIKPLRGVNNVWSNANNTIDLSYWTH